SKPEGRLALPRSGSAVERRRRQVLARRRVGAAVVERRGRDMRTRLTTVFACQSCGAVSPKWLGRCPECGEWNSYVEEARSERPSSAAPAPSSQAISEVAASVEDRISTGLPGLDRVLGGGLVPGSVVLLGGEPGIGKSTLLLQAARSIAA